MLEAKSHNDHIILEGLESNNLKGFDLQIPLQKFSVITGVSGSGKSSVLFDTLYSESYRRYLQSLSSFARQYMQKMPKPRLKKATNLPPALALRQFKMGRNRRSTVGTVSELTDLLQVLFSYLAKRQCWDCQREASSGSTKEILEWMQKENKTQTLFLLAPLASWQSLSLAALKEFSQVEGLSRFYYQDKIFPLSELKEKYRKEGFFLIEKIAGESLDPSLCMQSLELALKLGKQKIFIKSQKNKPPYFFASELHCSSCQKIFHRPMLEAFSFNHPAGACSHCEGFGFEAVINWEKVFPDRELSLSDKPIAALSFGSHEGYYERIKNSAKKNKIPLRKKLKDYTAHDWTWLKAGDKSDFNGMQGYFDWLDRKKYKAHYRMHKARYSKYQNCRRCKGARYSDDILSFKLEEKNLFSVQELSLEKLQFWLEQVKESSQTNAAKNVQVKLYWQASQDAFLDLSLRLEQLLKLGLSYLSSSRLSHSLSGGELQRVHLARSLASSLTDTLICLDEPTVGLHAKDIASLLSIIKELVNQGNTVVAVEHDQKVIDAADSVFLIGPGAGEKGGELCRYSKKDYQVHFAKEFKEKKTYLKKDFFELKGVKTQNLKNIDIKIPSSGLVSICGPSGSGKTSLVCQTLYPYLAKVLGTEGKEEELIWQAGFLGPKALLKRFSEVHLVSQEPLGRSTRSNLATYLGAFEVIRKIFAFQEKAKTLSLKAGAFSFNVPGGRCEACKGLGVITEELSFLGETTVLCSSCQGKRFQDTVLSVTYKGKNLLEVLSLTVSEARTLFYEEKKLCKIFDFCIDMGLAYLTLGQHTSSFSGGETQRLKLLNVLAAKELKGPSIFIFDEPTVGLSDKDVKKFLELLKKLCHEGHLIIAIEHHLGFLQACDYLIELGPESGEKGGELIFQGPLEKLLVRKSLSSYYLQQSL